MKNCFHERQACGQGEIMVKLCIKKLLMMLLCVGICLAVSFIGFGVLGSLANFFTNTVIRSTIIFGIPALIVLIAVQAGRRANQKLRQEYLEYCHEKKWTIGHEFRYILSFPDFLAEMIAFTAILMPLLIALCMSSGAPWWVNIVAALLLLGALAAVYCTVDVACWMVIHFLWKRPKRAKE